MKKQPDFRVKLSVYCKNRLDDAKFFAILRKVFRRQGE